MTFKNPYRDQQAVKCRNDVGCEKDQMSATASESQLVCERILTRDGPTGRSEVVVRLLEPVLAPHECVGDYRCAFEVDGLERPIRDYGYGIDSLQALISANTRAMYALWPVRQSLRLFDGSYDWSIAHCVQIDDAGRRRQIQAILEEEEYALAQWQLETELIRRAKAPKAPERKDADEQLAAPSEAKREADPTP